MPNSNPKRETNISGQVTTGGAFVAGDQNVEGNQYNAGRDVNITLVLQMPAFTPPPDLEQLRAEYLEHLKRQYRALDFKGIPQLETFSRELLLEEVYVPLVARPEMPAGDTWERRLAGRKFDARPEMPAGDTRERRLVGHKFDADALFEFDADELLEEVYVPLDTHLEIPEDEKRERRLAGRRFDADVLPDEAQMLLERSMLPAAPVQVQEAMRYQAQVVVIGDPGSGKSTLLKHLTLRLASEDGAPLPILVPLNAYADALSHGDRNLQMFLAEYFAGLAHGVAGLAPLFDRALAQGQAVILLDGLDEVQAQRGLLVNKVEAFAADATARGNKIVVTSRVVGYREALLDPKKWSLYTLLDFDDNAIEQFAHKWCTAFEVGTRGDSPEARADAERERVSLMESLRGNLGVTNLASNPLLLTILALIKRQGVALPKSRVKLYDIYLQTLINAWNKARALDKRPVGPELDYNQTIAVLEPLALWLRTENPTAGLVSERQMLNWLTEHFMGDDWGLKRGQAMERAGEFLQSVHKYSNLLVERGRGQYGFLHLTFEEALAAMGLVEKGQLDRNISIALIQEHLTDPAWRETILLAIGVWGLLYNQRLVAGEVVRAILNMECEGEFVGQNILVAGACLEDVGEPGLGRAAASEVTNALLDAAHNRNLPPTVQRDAGFSLGRAGWIPSDLNAFIEIPAGEFLYGENKKKICIEKPFAIAKYPVTNLQYRRFVDAGGYDKREFWSDEGWAWRTGKWDSKAPNNILSLMKKRSSEKRNGPFFLHDIKWNNPLVPVVGVNWFESEAYCNWYSAMQGRAVRLPTEQEWERAARHTDGRRYSWGNEFDRNRLNSIAFWDEQENQGRISEIYSTTIVGQFPEGSSAAGICDMSGNVWEWMIDDYDRANKVLRGGSFLYGRLILYCANRFRVTPVNFSYDVGFRLLSPGA